MSVSHWLGAARSAQGARRQHRVHALQAGGGRSASATSWRSKLRAGGYGWGHAKQELLDVLESELGPMRERYRSCARDEAQLDKTARRRRRARAHDRPRHDGTRARCHRHRREEVASRSWEFARAPMRASKRVAGAPVEKRPFRSAGSAANRHRRARQVAPQASCGSTRSACSLEGNYKSEKENVDEDIAVAGKGPFRVEVDLMQPIDPEKKPKVNDPALNHIGLWVDDFATAVKWLESPGRALHARRYPQGRRRLRRHLHPSQGRREVSARRRRRADRAGASAAGRHPGLRRALSVPPSAVAGPRASKIIVSCSAAEGPLGAPFTGGAGVAGAATGVWRNCRRSRASSSWAI